MTGRACLSLVLLLLTAGCATVPEPDQSHPVRYVRIRDSVSPKDLYAHIGDEIRWQNLRTEPVMVGLLGAHVLDNVLCQRGFMRFGRMDGITTIQPQDYVSLCFARRGVVRYNVWMDPEDLRTMSRTAVIHLAETS